MKQEWIDRVTKTGVPTGQKYLKHEIHQKGYYHNTVHLWFYTTTKHILLAQRAASKLICPNLWDVSVAGHVHAGETLIHAVIRESNEELGITITENKVIPIGVFLHENEFYNGSIKDYEFHNIYIAELHYNLSDLVLQHTEVQAVKLVSFDQFHALLANSTNNLYFIPNNKTYYEFVIHTIERRITSGTDV